VKKKDWKVERKLNRETFGAGGNFNPGRERGTLARRGRNASKPKNDFCDELGYLGGKYCGIITNFLKIFQFFIIHGQTLANRTKPGPNLQV
jgi:hypothetical protein